MMSDLCPDCNGSGRFRERGRLYGDPGVNITCDCIPRDTAAHEDMIARERAAQAEADRLIARPPHTASEGVKSLANRIHILEDHLNEH